MQKKKFLSARRIDLSTGLESIFFLWNHHRLSKELAKKLSTLLFLEEEEKEEDEEEEEGAFRKINGIEAGLLAWLPGKTVAN